VSGRNPNKLTACWSKRENDILYSFPSKPDGHLLNSVISAPRQRYDYTTDRVEYEPSLREELAARGYDITTLRFSIERKPKGDANG
jgi:hypothetical protein